MEQENMLVACDHNKVLEHQHDKCKIFTHCEIIPQGVLGITTLVAAYGNHNQTPRVVFLTSQAKQTCGTFCLNWPYRIDKDTFLQYFDETPLVRTLSNNYLFPNGASVMVAIMCGAYNIEDSIIISQRASERMLFFGVKFTYY